MKYLIEYNESNNMIKKFINMHGKGRSSDSLCPICGLSFDENFRKSGDYEVHHKMNDTKNFEMFFNDKKVFDSDKVTLLFKNNSVKHCFKYDTDHIFYNSSESIDLTDYITKKGPKGGNIVETELLGIPVHTECYNLSLKKFNHKLKYSNFNRKNITCIDEVQDFICSFLNYKPIDIFWEQYFYWSDIPDESNKKYWYLICSPLGTSNEAKKNAERISKNIEKIIKNSQNNNLDKNIIKKDIKKDRPSPSESATDFKEGTKKKGNDGNMYIIAVNKNGVKRWKKYIK